MARRGLVMAGAMVALVLPLSATAAPLAMLSMSTSRATTRAVELRESTDAFGLVERMNGSFYLTSGMSCRRRTVLYVRCTYVARGGHSRAEPDNELICQITVAVRLKRGARKPMWRRGEPDCLIGPPRA